MRLRLTRTDSKDPDFLRLVELLDAELAERDGEDNAFYSQYNGLEQIRHAVLCYTKEGEAAGCGAMKQFDPGTMEVKRMYVLPSHRGEGIATEVLRELEKWAADLKMSRIILETGKRQPEAIRLYEKNGYLRTENFGPYVGIENSVCFEKRLT
jgi:GNAT superfamily N-acetyltransferase